MKKTAANAVVIGRLILMGLLLAIRWIMQVPFVVFLVLYSFFEMTVVGSMQAVNYLKTLNDESFTADK
jgi:hypothetical protein